MTWFLSDFLCCCLFAIAPHESVGWLVNFYKFVVRFSASFPNSRRMLCTAAPCSNPARRSPSQFAGTVQVSMFPVKFKPFVCDLPPKLSLWRGESIRLYLEARGDGETNPRERFCFPLDSLVSGKLSLPAKPSLGSRSPVTRSRKRSQAGIHRYKE